jgi:hypothetical protein
MSNSSKNISNGSATSKKGRSKSSTSNHVDGIVVRPVPTHFRSHSNNSINSAYSANSSIGFDNDELCDIFGTTSTSITGSTHNAHESAFKNKNVNVNVNATKCFTTEESANVSFKSSSATSSFPQKAESSSSRPTRPSSTSTSLFTPPVMNHKPSAVKLSSSLSSKPLPSLSSRSSFITTPLQLNMNMNMNTRTIFTTNSKGGSFSIYKNKSSTRSKMQSPHFFHRHSNNNDNSNNDSNDCDNANALRTPMNTNQNHHQQEHHQQNRLYNPTQTTIFKSKSSSSHATSFNAISSSFHTPSSTSIAPTTTSSPFKHKPTPIRASPFEPIVKDKQCGKISPLSMEEYEAWVAKRDYERQQEQLKQQDRQQYQYSKQTQKQKQRQQQYQYNQYKMPRQYDNEEQQQRPQYQPGNNENNYNNSGRYTFRPVVISPFIEENENTNVNLNGISNGSNSNSTEARSCSCTPANTGNARIAMEKHDATATKTVTNEYYYQYDHDDDEINDDLYDHDIMSYSSSSSSYEKNDIDRSLLFDDECDDSSTSSSTDERKEQQHQQQQQQVTTNMTRIRNHRKNNKEEEEFQDYHLNLGNKDKVTSGLRTFVKERCNMTADNNINSSCTTGWSSDEEDEQSILCCRMAGSSILSHQCLLENKLCSNHEGEEGRLLYSNDFAVVKSTKKRPGTEDKDSSMIHDRDHLPLKRSRVK